MPIEVHDNGSMTITGQDGMEIYRRVTLYHALKLQANTGMKMTRISSVACARRLGYSGRTAKSLLADMEKKHPELKRDS